MLVSARSSPKRRLTGITFRVGCLLPGRSRSGVGVGIDTFWLELESDLESLEIRRLGRPGSEKQTRLELMCGHFRKLQRPLTYYGYILSIVDKAKLFIL